MNVIQYCNDNDIKDSSSGQNTSIFYQNGEIGPLANFDKSLPVLRISTIIYADNITISQGIYGSDSPNIFSGKKINIFFNTGNYYYIDGIWKNGMVSGTAIKREAVTTTSGDSWIFTYTGNIENNMFHGDITFSWQKPDGSESDSDIIHAEHGTLDCLWEENGKYVYAQGSSGVYWFKDSLKGLEGYSYELY